MFRMISKTTREGTTHNAPFLSQNPMEFYVADFYHLTTSNNKNLPSINQIHKLRIPSPLAKELDKHRPKAMEALEHAR